MKKLHLYKERSQSSEHPSDLRGFGSDPLLTHGHPFTAAALRGTELEVPDNLVRLSVGIEGVGDLVADILQALDK